MIKSPLMKNLKSISLALFITLTSTLAFAQELTPVTIAYSNSLNGATEVFIDLNGQVSTEFWDKDYIKVIMQIKAKGVSKKVIKYLISKKRFFITGKKISDTLYKISMPNINKPIFINGQEIQEELSFQIFLPHHTLSSTEFYPLFVKN